MGVTISCTKTGRTIDVGSGGFLRLRSKISELVGEPWASHYRALVEERICDEKEREKFYEDFDKKTEALLNKKRISVKIVDFCLQSDCEGSIRYGACKELLKVIGNYDDNICYGYAGREDCAMFRDFKKILEDCGCWLLHITKPSQKRRNENEARISCQNPDGRPAHLRKARE